MPTGTVKFFNSRKGFGFITGADNKDTFVHISALEHSTPPINSLKDGERVSFELAPDREGRLCADQLRVIS